MGKVRRKARAIADELGLTTPKPVKAKRRAARKRVPARSLRARGD